MKISSWTSDGVLNIVSNQKRYTYYKVNSLDRSRVAVLIKSKRFGECWKLLSLIKDKNEKGYHR